jgi:hypothetical protein
MDRKRRTGRCAPGKLLSCGAKEALKPSPHSNTSTENGGIIDLAQRGWAIWRIRI